MSARISKRNRRLLSSARSFAVSAGTALAAVITLRYATNVVAGLEQSTNSAADRSPLPRLALSGEHVASLDLPLPRQALDRRRRSYSLPWPLASARTRTGELAALAASAGAVGLVHAWGMGRYPALFDDEGTYVSQAYAVDHLHSLAPYTYWYDHPPLGWILLGAWAKVIPVFGGTSLSISSARAFILCTTILSACLVFGIARRLRIRRSLSALAVLLFGLSPLALHYQRMVLLDNIAVPWLLGAFFFALTPRRRLIAFIASGTCFACAALTKETFLLLLPALAYVIWQRSRGVNRGLATVLSSTFFMCVGAFYPLFAVLRGELLQGRGHTSLMYGIDFQLFSRKGGGSVFNSHSATRSLVEQWLHTDPVVLIAAVALTPLVLTSRRFRPIALAFALPILMICRPNGYVPAMYVIGLIPFAALTIAAAAEFLVSSAHSSRIRTIPLIRTALVVAGVAAALAPAALAARAWPARDHAAMTTDAVSADRQALAWLSAHVNHRATLLTDDTLWTDLVERGFSRNKVVWFYKLDLDPAVRRPWWRFDYVVRTNLFAGNLYWLPRSRRVFDHTRLVAAFDSAGERIEIRRVIKPTPTAAVFAHQ